MEMYFKNSRNETFMLKIFNASEERVDKILDELNMITDRKHIGKEDLKFKNPITINVMDGNIKVAELTCENPGI